VINNFWVYRNGDRLETCTRYPVDRDAIRNTILERSPIIGKFGHTLTPNETMIQTHINCNRHLNNWVETRLKNGMTLSQALPEVQAMAVRRFQLVLSFYPHKMVQYNKK
jgi:hypothetical protein